MPFALGKYRLITETALEFRPRLQSANPKRSRMRSSKPVGATVLLLCGGFLFGQTVTGEQATGDPHVYKAGVGGVGVPHPMFTPDPEFSEEARKEKCGGNLVVWAIVGPDGKTHNASVVLPLGLGLDEKAIEAVRRWKFEPALKEGKPVSVQINIEVSFRLDKMNVARGEVIGDTTGTDLSQYVATLVRKVQTHWCKLIPPGIGLKKGEVTVHFAVLKNGQLADPQMTSGSGDAVLDQAALSGITTSEPFDQLPPEFKGDSIGLRMHFLYNSDGMTNKHSESSH